MLDMEYNNYQKEYLEKLADSDQYRVGLLNDLNNFIDTQKVVASDNLRKWATPKFFRKNQAKIRKQYIEMLGFPLNAKLEKGEKVQSTYVYSNDIADYFRVKIEVFPNFYAYGILAKNKNIKVCPLVICQHGKQGYSEGISHWNSKITNYNHIIDRLVSKGTTVFAPTLYLWKEEDCSKEYDRDQLDAQLRALGGSLVALEITMILRVIDYFEKQPYIDANKIGMAGLSYGGMFTLAVTAVDKRIKSAYSTCYFNDRQKWIFNDWAYKNLFNTFNDAQVAGLIAPRSLCIELGDKDTVCNAQNCQFEIELLKEYYSQFKAQDRLLFNVFDGRHEVNKLDIGLDFFIQNLIK